MKQTRKGGQLDNVRYIYSTTDTEKTFILSILLELQYVRSENAEFRFQ